MKTLLAIVAVLLGVFVVVGILWGWIEFRGSDTKQTIEINTERMKDDVEEGTQQAVDASRDFVEETGETLESTGERMQQEDADADGPDFDDQDAVTVPPTERTVE